MRREPDLLPSSRPAAPPAVLVGWELVGPLRHQNAKGQQRLFYRHDGSSFCVSEPINGDTATLAKGGTIGFKCSSAEQVHQFHDTAVAHGGTSIEQPPGLREGKLGAKYLAYVRDPDGRKLCALHRPR